MNHHIMCCNCISRANKKLVKCSLQSSRPILYRGVRTILSSDTRSEYIACSATAFDALLTKRQDKLGGRRDLRTPSSL
jgi:hypothetical protein